MSSLLPFLMIALMATLVEQLLPGGESARLAKPLHAVAGLCILAALLSPLKEGLSLLHDLTSNQDYALSQRLEELFPGDEPFLYGEEGYAEHLSQQLAASGATEVQAWVKQALQQQFGIPATQCEVTVDMQVQVPVHNSETVTASVAHVWILLRGNSIFKNPHIIEEWFSQQLCCTCTVSLA